MSYQLVGSPSWEDFQTEESSKDYFKVLTEKIDYLYSEDALFFRGTYPPKELIYRCFKETPLKDVKVVILGQDPYHQPGQANGLAFAVNKDIPLPPSLKNVIKESGCTDTTLVKWAQQGVLLLNTSLCVIESKPGSCSGIGWETYTDAAIKYLLEHAGCNQHIIFCLWGNWAKTKKDIINGYKEVTILESSHPSPLSAFRGFIGCDHFKKINEILESKGEPIIIW